MADIQFNMTLDLVEQYVPAENITVVQENYQSVEFLFTIMNRGETVDLTGATNIVVSFIKPDGHIVLQNDGLLVNGKVELVANPEAFTYVGKTYLQIQYKIGTKIFNTRQAFIWVERGNTSCQTLSSTDFAPMLDQAIQAGQMLANIDLQALIDSKVTAENAQQDVDNLELRVGALEVTIVGLNSRVDALEASQAAQDGKITSLQNSQTTLDSKVTTLEAGQSELNSRVTSVEGNITTVTGKVDTLQGIVADHETRIDGLEASMPNLDPINTAITALQAKDVQQDGRIGANELAISEVQTKNTQQDTAIAGNTTEIGKLQTEQTTQNNRLTAVENKNASQDSAIGDIQTNNTQQDAAISALQSSQATQDVDIAAIKTKNTQQDTVIAVNSTSIAAVDTKVDANKSAQDTVNSGVTGTLSNHSTRIETLEADATVDDARITNLEGDNTSNKSHIATVEGAIGVLNSDINDLQGNDAVQDSRLNAIETKNTTQDGLIAANSAAITANKTDADSKITGLTTRVGTNETDITALKAKDVTHETRMSAIENKNNAQDTRMDTIEGVNATQNTRLTDIENKNTSQDTAITGKVSKVGDTMTGDLKLSKTSASARYVEWMIDNTPNFRVGQNSSNNFVFYDVVNNAIPLEYKLDTRKLQVNSSTVGGFDVNCDTNLLKKTDAYYTAWKPDGYGNNIHGLDLDTVNETGNYFGNNLLNSPDGSTAYFHVQVQRVANSTSFVQIAVRWSSPQMFYRTKVNTGAWSAWEEIADKGSVVQKTGDSMTGALLMQGTNAIVDSDSSGILQGGGNTAKRWRMYQSGNSELSFVPSATNGGNDWEWGKAFRIKPDGTTFTPKDGRVSLTLTADATNFDTSRAPIAVRRGNTVTLRGAFSLKSDAVGITATTIPDTMRPTDVMTITVLATDGTYHNISIHISGDINIPATAKGKNIYLSHTYVVD